METIYVTRIGEVRKNKKNLERKLGVKIAIKGGRVSFHGKSLDEYDAAQVFEAISFGFSSRKALRLKNEDYVFRIVHIKEHTKRNLKDIKSRLIGTHGRTRKTVSGISGCDVLIQEGDVGIIGDVENVANAEIAVISLIKGSKQSNMYKFLEKRNRLKKEDDFNLDKK